MLSKSIRDDISIRLGLFVKYTVSGGFYWDSNQLRFIPLKTYIHWTWWNTYYIGHLFQILLLANLIYQTSTNHDIPEDLHDLTTQSENLVGKNYLLAFTTVLIWVLVYIILAMNSLCRQYRDELMETFNQAFILDSQMQKLFKISGNNSEQKHVEMLVKFICWFPPCLAPAFCMSLFHPQDPIHDLLENLLEIEISGKSPFTWVVVGVECLFAFELVGIAEQTILVVFLTVYTSRYWLEAATPTHSKLNTFLRTSRLGNLSEDTAVWIYRSFQVLTGLCNVIVATVRFATHSASMIVILNVACFALIKRGGLLFQDGSPMSYSLAGILGTAIFLPVFIFYLECYFVDRLDCAWKQYRKNILSITLQKSAIYKTALSFSGVTVKSTYPFCNVNRSTFPEWLSAAVDMLVNLLVSS